MDRKHIVTIAAIIIIASGASTAYIMTEQGTDTTIVNDMNIVDVIQGSNNVSRLEDLEQGSSSVKVPAVDNYGTGVVTFVKVSALKGSGKTLVDIDQLIYWGDTQYSIQVSKFVAEYYTGYNLSKTDVMYSIETNANLIEGPSAGAALTIATISALYDQPVKDNVMITGTISPDGTIGSVGGVLEKAIAAKDVGATLFLVPFGQSEQNYFERTIACEPIGPIKYCTTQYIPISTNIGEDVGIEVIEVLSIEEALPYFIDLSDDKTQNTE